MLAAVRSAALVGIDAYDVIVEVDAAPGLPQWTIVGLAATFYLDLSPSYLQIYILNCDFLWLAIFPR